jgi:hypothetical protein
MSEKLASAWGPSNPLPSPRAMLEELTERAALAGRKARADAKARAAAKRGEKAKQRSS